MVELCEQRNDGSFRAGTFRIITNFWRKHHTMEAVVYSFFLMTTCNIVNFCLSTALLSVTENQSKFLRSKRSSCWSWEPQRCSPVPPRLHSAYTPLHYHWMATNRRGRTTGAPASYSGCPAFKSQHRSMVYELRCHLNFPQYLHNSSMTIRRHIT